MAREPVTSAPAPDIEQAVSQYLQKAQQYAEQDRQSPDGVWNMVNTDIDHDLGFGNSHTNVIKKAVRDAFDVQLRPQIAAQYKNAQGAEDVGGQGDEIAYTGGDTVNEGQGNADDPLQSVEDEYISQDVKDSFAPDGNGNYRVGDYIVPLNQDGTPDMNKAKELMEQVQEEKDAKFIRQDIRDQFDKDGTVNGKLVMLNPDGTPNEKHRAMLMREEEQKLRDQEKEQQKTKDLEEAYQKDDFRGYDKKYGTGGPGTNNSTGNETAGGKQAGGEQTSPGSGDIPKGPKQMQREAKLPGSTSPGRNSVGASVSTGAKPHKPLQISGKGTPGAPNKLINIGKTVNNIANLNVGNLAKAYLQKQALAAVAAVGWPAISGIIIGVIVILLGLGLFVGVAHAAYCEEVVVVRYPLESALIGGGGAATSQVTGGAVGGKSDLRVVFEEICLTPDGCRVGGISSFGGSGYDCASNRVSWDGGDGKRGNIADLRFVPDNSNVYYALLMMRAQEFNGFDEDYVGGDRDSCGPYQQRIREIRSGQSNTLAQAAEQIRVQLGMSPITSCQQLVEEGGNQFFDRLAIERLRIEGALDDIENADMTNDAGITRVAQILCNTQRPDAYSVSARECPIDSYYVENIAAAGKEFVAADQFNRRKAECQGSPEVVGRNTRAVPSFRSNGSLIPAYARLKGLVDISEIFGNVFGGVPVYAQQSIINGVQTHALSVGRQAGIENSVRGGILLHNDHAPFPGSDQTIYSPVNGVVVAIENGFPNNTSWSLANPSFGNYVVIQITDGPYAGLTYAIGHIDKEIPVAVGQTISVGQAIGSIEFGSGSGTGRHWSSIVMNGDATTMADSLGANHVAATASFANVTITGNGSTASVTLNGDVIEGNAIDPCSSTLAGRGTVFVNGEYNPVVAESIVNNFVNNYTFDSETKKAVEDTPQFTSGQIAWLEGGNLACAFVTSRIISQFNPELGQEIFTLGAEDQYRRALAAGGVEVTDPEQIGSYGLIFYSTTPGGQAGHVGVVYRDSSGNLREVSNRSSLRAPVNHSSLAEAQRIYSGIYGNNHRYVAF